MWEISDIFEILVYKLITDSFKKRGVIRGY